MYAVIRHYKGNPQLMDELAQRTSDVEQLIRDVPGFVTYCLARTGDGGFSISIYEDRAGTEESTRRAAEWIKENVPAAAERPPEVIEGETILQFSK
jgi:heme-degrading monooxygenase HmoA